MKISLGSTSVNKKNILLEVLSDFTITDIVYNNVSSDISEQPLSEEETIQGAKNRAKNSFLIDQTVDMSFGMEGGLSKIDGIYYLVCVTAIYTKDGSYYLGISSKLPLPKDVSEKIDKGEEFGVLVREYQQTLSKDSDLYFLVEKLIDRKDLFKESIQNALLIYKSNY